LDAPVDQPDWKAAVEGLIYPGEIAHKAAQTKSLDEMLTVSETVVNSCSACHDKYRDVDLEGGTRCQVKK
jgi:cytochrome c556